VRVTVMFEKKNCSFRIFVHKEIGERARGGEGIGRGAKKERGRWLTRASKNRGKEKRRIGKSLRRVATTFFNESKDGGG